ncbi:MAG: hypothetical protein ABEK84_02610, partial [Salinibacter sp.]
MPTDQVIEIGLIFVLVITLGGLVVYLYRLRSDFYRACVETDNLLLFADCPMGLPVGSVRSTLALLIVLFAVGYIGVTGLTEPPQFLTAIVSTVLGFYFGSRSSSESRKDIKSVLDKMGRRPLVSTGSGPSTPTTGESAEPSSVEPPSSGPSASAPTSPKPSTDTAPPPARRQEAQQLLSRLQDGLSITEVARSVLPRPLRKQFSSLVQALRNGVDTVEGLMKADSVEEALQEGKKLLERYRKENPVRKTIEDALGSFDNVLGAAVKPLPLIGSIVNVAASVKTQLYDRWRARILHLSFEPSDLPIERVDANTGFTLLVNTPIMKEAFREELEANDRSFLENTAEELLSTGELESLWQNYSDRFESRQQFEDGVAVLRREAADLELKEELDSSL